MAVFVLAVLGICGQWGLSPVSMAEEQGGFPIAPLNPFGMSQEEQVEGEMQEDFPIALLDSFGMSQEEQADEYIKSVLPARRTLLPAPPWQSRILVVSSSTAMFS